MLEEARQLLMDLATRASKGDAEALAMLCPLLDVEPLKGLTKQCGDLTRAVELKLLSSATGKDLLTRELLGRRVAELRKELVEPGAGPVERLLQEQVVLCWLFVRVAELRAAGRPNSFPEGDFYGRQLSRAQGRYLAAVRALLAARKLLRPSPSPLELASRVLDEAPEARGGRLGGRAGVGGN